MRDEPVAQLPQACRTIPRYHSRNVTLAPPHRRDVEPLIAAIRSRLTGVLGVWLFGSLASGRARPESDIDLAVLAARPVDGVQLFDLGLDLGVMAGRDVDLIDLRRVSTVMRKEVVTEGVLVWAGDQAACAAFASDSLALYVALQEELNASHAGAPRNGRETRG
jgi:predicted nucleotidyltransferase